MLVSPFILSVAQLNPDFILTDVHGKRLKVIAFMIEASSAFQIEATTMPVTGENAMPNHTPGQGITHMGALIVGSEDPSIDVEQRDAPTRAEPDRFGGAIVNIAERCYPNPL